MAAPERADDEREREGTEAVGVRPDESGARLRTHGAYAESDAHVEVEDAEVEDAEVEDAEVEDDEEEELELVEVVVAPRRRPGVPPPLPRRAPPEHFDLDQLLSDLVRPSAGPPVSTTIELDPPVAPLVERASEPAPPPRSRYGIAVVVGVTGIVVGAVTAAVLLGALRSEPGAGEPPAAEARQPAIVPPIVEEPVAVERTPAPAPSAAEVPEPAPLALAPVHRSAAEPEQRPAPRRSVAATTREAPRREHATAQTATQTDEAVTGEAVAATNEAATNEAATNEAATNEAATEQAATAEAVTEAAAEASAQAEPVATTAEAAGEAPEASGPPLPEHPSREDVDAAVNRVMPALRACGQGLDLITLELHFASSGRATTASTDARHLTPQQRSCVARAARGARVPPFSAPHLSVRYPVRL